MMAFISRQRNQIKAVTKQTKIPLLKMRGIYVKIENYGLVLNLNFLKNYWFASGVLLYILNNIKVHGC